jgi:succinyl-CoA synthetase alpha subunit
MTGPKSATAVRRNRYVDSVLLMHVSKRLTQEPDVTDAFLVMATPRNRADAIAAGYPRDEIEDAGPDDLLVCVRATSSEAATSALGRIDVLLDERGPRRTSAASIEDAMSFRPGANIASISVPGEYAADEARRALENGLNVFLFSSGVSIEDEVAIKQMASERDLLVMGPDCGTSIIAGVGLGFANAVRRGPIGVVGASGTGTQAVTTMVHRMGSGISHAIGVGSRDLSDEVGGISTLAALDALDADDGTRLVILLGKSAGRRTRQLVERRTRAMRKPVLECLLGPGAKTLEATAEEAIAMLGLDRVPLGTGEEAGAHRRATHPDRRFIRGLFAGGTFCAEAQMIFLDAGVQASSNAPLLPHLQLGPRAQAGHALIDMGTEEYTVGRPHPMIDSRARCDRLLLEARDPEVAVLLLDVVLGYGAAPDPAGDLVDALKQVEQEADGEIPIVASVCGTEADPQDFERQVKTLEEAGVLVMPTSSRATTMALELAGARS